MQMLLSLGLLTYLLDGNYIKGRGLLAKNVENCETLHSGSLNIIRL